MPMGPCYTPAHVDKTVHIIIKLFVKNSLYNEIVLFLNPIRYPRLSRYQSQLPKESIRN